MSDLYNQDFINILKRKINNGDFSNKNELINYLQKLSESIIKDPVLIERLKKNGIIINSSDLNGLTTELLTYYDKTKADISSLNLDGVSQVSIDGTDYIKISNPDGTYSVLDDSLSQDNFVQQFQNRQNESYDYQTNDGVKNKEAITKDMKQDKEEANLTSSINLNTRNLTPEERRQFAAIMRASDADAINFVVDPTRNIYINKDTGELFYAYKNKEGKMEVRKAEERTAETFSSDVEYIDDKGKEKMAKIETPNASNFENLDDFELQYIVDNKLDSLTPEQKETIFRIIERRKEIVSQQETLDNKTKQEQQSPKVLTKKNIFINQPYNGYASVFLLSLITLIWELLMIYFIIKIF